MATPPTQVEGLLLYVMLLFGLGAILRLVHRHPDESGVPVAPLQHGPVATEPTGWRALVWCLVEILLLSVIGVTVWLLFRMH